VFVGRAAIPPDGVPGPNVSELIQMAPEHPRWYSPSQKFTRVVSNGPPNPLSLTAFVHQQLPKLGKSLQILRVKGVNLSLRLLNTCARIQNPNVVPVIAVTDGAFLGGKGEGYPEPNLWIKEHEPRPHNTHNSERAPV
jgi:hypothetical protein